MKIFITYIRDGHELNAFKTEKEAVEFLVNYLDDDEVDGTDIEELLDSLDALLEEVEV